MACAVTIQLPGRCPTVFCNCLNPFETTILNICCQNLLENREIYNSKTKHGEIVIVIVRLEIVKVIFSNMVAR